MIDVKHAALAGALLGAAMLAGPAHAATPETEQLCGDDKVRCSIQAPVRWVEGGTQQVGVTGRSNTTVTLRAHRLAVTAQGAVTWEPLTAETEVTTDDHGWGRVDLTFPALPTGEHGGPVVVALSEAAGRDLGSVLGAWTELVSTTPELVGDGFDDHKPVGTPLQMVLDHVAPGTEYTVERREGGTWVPVPAGDGAAAPAAAATCAASRCEVTYNVPRGLAPGAHDFRLVDARSGTSPTAWTVRPHPAGKALAHPQPEIFPVLSNDVAGSLMVGTGQDTSAVVRPRDRNLDVSRLRDGAPAAATGGHSVRTVQAVCVGTGTVALLLLLAPWRRRSWR